MRDRLAREFHKFHRQAEPARRDPFVLRRAAVSSERMFCSQAWLLGGAGDDIVRWSLARVHGSTGVAQKLWLLEATLAQVRDWVRRTGVQQEV